MATAPITGVELDPDVILAAILASYVSLGGDTLGGSDPRRLILATTAYELAQQNAMIEAAARGNLVGTDDDGDLYATGTSLEALAAFVGLSRLPASASVCTLRWTLTGVQPNAITIPLGNRATANGDILWKTTEIAEVAIGDLFVDVAARATTTGAATNGFVAGQIATIVDPIAHVASVANTDTTSGGGDEETDAELTARILLAPGAYSVAGPIDSYKSHTYAVNTTITDVSVESPTPGDVVVTFVLDDGAIPGATLIAEVLAALSAEEVRPLTDNVTVQAPSTLTYAITLTYYISTDDSGEATAIQAAVDAAILAWITWQRSALGRDVNPSKLIADILAAGAKRVVLTDPAFAAIDTDEIAIVDGAGVGNVTYGGLEAP